MKQNRSTGKGESNSTKARNMKHEEQIKTSSKGFRKAKSKSADESRINQNSRGRGELEPRQNRKLTKVSATQNCNQRTPKMAIRTTATGERANRTKLNAVNPDFCRNQTEIELESSNYKQFETLTNNKP